MPPAARRVIVAHAAAAIGMSLPWPLLLLEVWTASHDEALLGLAAAARMLPYVAISWAAGRLADRWCRQRLVVATLVMRVLLLMLVGVAVQQANLLVAVGAATAAIAVATPAYPALAAGMPALAGARRQRATELLVTVEVSSFVVGPALGGLFLAPSLRPWIAVVAVGLVLVGLALMVGVDLPAPARSDRVSSSSGVLTLMVGEPRVLRAVLAVCAVNAVLSAAGLALLPLAEQEWRDGDLWFGIATAALGFGALAGPALTVLGREPAARARRGMACIGAPLVLVAATPHAVWALVPLAVAGAAAVQVEGVATSVIQESVPDRSRATVLGITDSAMVAAALLASLAAPGLATLLGARGFVVLLGGVCVVLVLARRRAGVSRPLDRVARSASGL